jgi:nucleotide-binding universal stress UspA family protein
LTRSNQENDIMTLRLTFPPKNRLPEASVQNRIPGFDRLAPRVPLVDTERYILYPTDFSGVSRCAFELSCALARQTGRRLVVMHVVPDSGPRLGLATAPPARAGRLQAWETRLRSLQARDSSLDVEYVVTEGDPREEIFGRAQAVQCDLVVTGSREGWKLARLLRQGVGASLQQRCPRPLLTVTIPPLAASSRDERAPRDWRPRTILHATDLTAPAMYGFEVARALARETDGELILVHFPPLALGARAGRDRAERLLHLMVDADPELRSRVELLEKDPVNSLLQLERETGADVVVIGTHGSSGMTRVLQNIVARDLKKQAASPVLTVRLPGDARGFPMFPGTWT